MLLAPADRGWRPCEPCVQRMAGTIGRERSGIGGVCSRAMDQCVVWRDVERSGTLRRLCGRRKDWSIGVRADFLLGCIRFCQRGYRESTLEPDTGNCHGGVWMDISRWIL